MYQVNRKRFSIFLLGVSLIISFFVGMFFSIRNKYWEKIITKGEQQKTQENNEKKETEKEKLPKVENANNDTKNQEQVEEKEKTERKTVIEYNNSRYKYKIRFFDKWGMNNDFSENDFEDVTIGDKKIFSGGQTFWSNYKNINEYTPENKPEDFYMLNLTIYQDDKNNEDEFANKLGLISDDWEFKKEEFQAKNINGYEYVSPGTPGNPVVAIIFKKDNFFYVFRLAFISGNGEIAKEMEAIISTFELI